MTQLREVASIMAKCGGDGHFQSSARGLALVRIFLGAFFLFEGITKLMEQKQFIKLLASETLPYGSFVMGSMWQWFDGFLIKTVHPNATLVGWIFMIAAVLIGLFFLAGFLTRLAALLAIPITLFYLFATWKGLAPPFGNYPPLVVHVAFLVMEIGVFIAAAGRTWGVDAYLARKTKVKLLW